jgi:benzoate/toluate 1,2-dioxygenase beta subunit
MATQIKSTASSVPAPDGGYITRALHADVEAFVSRMRARPSASADRLPQAAVRDIESFLYDEASLLDRRRYREWFELLSEDFVYWVPSTYQDSNLDREVAINLDDRRRLLDRIAYTETGVQVAQIPVSRTLRVVSNVRGWNGPGSSIEVAANVVIWEYRKGRMNAFVAAEHFMLTRHDSGYRIKIKVLHLLDCDQPQGNNSFIL